MITKLHASTLMAGEHQTHDYYMNIGPTFSDPIARQLYAEIASIEEQHVTQYESIIDATETLAREVAAARGDRGVQLLQLRGVRVTRTSSGFGSASSTMNSGTCGSSRTSSNRRSVATRPKSCRRPYPSPSARATATSSARCYRQRST